MIFLEMLLRKDWSAGRRLTAREEETLELLSVQDELASTAGSYVLCLGCFSLEDDVFFFAGLEHVREVLRKGGW